ncbi:SLC13 family permease [Chromobacterium alticapitis]|uniref:Cyclic nucleotide-binding domain-containing protein n=1 Tax=Chromobacterium alticapitis TaxID=2073169 RepID=A0A2S5DH29_9NEIS|nr:SLC13 family permease [Chromobacterium alticapitis]POZ62298.1 hypothetical protein C2I19_09015 [Chromobacterium alticapitis]
MTHAPDSKDLDELWRHPALQSLTPTERARLASRLRLRNLAPDERLFSSGDPAEQLYLIRSGSLTLRHHERQWSQQAGFVGGEAALGSLLRCSDAQADCETQLYELALPGMQELADRHPALKAALFASFANQAAPDAPPAPPSVPERGAWREIAGWLTAIAAPLLAWHISQAQLPPDSAIFIGILACTAAMWIFNLVPAFVPALFALLAIVLFDIAPVSVAASGFASNGFFMLLSVFAIGALMTVSGLTYRISLWILRRVPATPRWQQASLCLYGLALTPVMPSQLARGAILAPFLSALLESGDKRRDAATAAGLFSSAIGGMSLAAAVFLTGKPANLVVFGLFDNQTQFAFDWLPWLCAASLSGALLLAMHFAAMRLLFRRASPQGIPARVIALQADALGPMNRKERHALIAISLVLLGTLSAPYHQVDISWLSLATLVVLLLFGALRNEDLNQRVDWSVLIFIGSIIAWVPVMNLTGIDRQIAATFGWLGLFMKSSLPAFLGLLCLAIVLLRLVLPELVAEILLLTLLLPLAHAAGVSQWLIGFAVLTMCESYLFPYQAPYHLLLDSQLAALQQAGCYDRGLVLRYNLAMTLARALSIFAALPFWSLLDIV